MYYVDKKSAQTINFERITFGNAMLIGLFQAAALIPGVSRSGITMTAARLLGFTREAAARFSILLATPIIAGAALKHARDILHNIASPLFVVGAITSAIVGLICIKFLLRYLQRNSFAVFAAYRICMALVICAVYLFRQ